MKILQTLFASTLVAALSLTSSLSYASGSVTDNNPHFGEKGWDVKLGIGIFSATDSVYQRDDDDYEEGLTIPLSVTWYGEDLHFTADEREGLLLGYTFVRRDNWAVDGILSPRGTGPFDNDLLEDLDDRDIDFHAGIRYTRYGLDSAFKLEASKDISSTHDGYILSAAYEKEWQLRNWIVTVTSGIGLISEDMIDYYFGVNSSEATTQFPEYNADQTTLAFLSVQGEHPINESWVFITQLEHAFLGSEISDSPITTNDGGITLVSASMVYQF